jgi:hypothetical protein
MNGDKIILFPEDRKVVDVNERLQSVVPFVEEVSPGMWIIIDAGIDHLRSLASKVDYKLTSDDQILLAMALLELVGLREQFDIVKKKLEEIIGKPT